MADDAQLVLIRGPQTGETVHLDGDTITLGRAPQNDVVIDHLQVSRHHARLTRERGTWVIDDLDSTNGTFVNGAHVSQPRALTRGDVIELGEAVALVYRHEVAAPEDAGRSAQVPPPSAPPQDQASGGADPARQRPAAGQTRDAEQTYPPRRIEPPQRSRPADRAYSPPRAPSRERTLPEEPTARPFDQASPAPPPSHPQEVTPPDRTWLWVGIGCLVLLLIVACAAVFVLDALGVLPAFFYEPLRWLGLI